jgi:hypothetical protein
MNAWDSVYRRVAGKAVDYWAKYKEPPGEHTLDLFADVESGDKKQAGRVRRIYESIQETKDGINAPYVISQLSAFLREQRLRTGIIEAVELLEQGDIQSAETRVRKSIDGVLDVFDPGTLFHKLDVNKLLTEKHIALPTGIPLLDIRGLGPTAGELCLFVAPPGYGKSWWLLHLAKHALLNRLKVVFITLEMSETRVAQRFLQSFFAISKRKETITNRSFVENELGQFYSIKSFVVKSSSFADKNISKLLTKKLKGFERRPPLVIKQFPTGALTVQELEGYLDSLEMSQRFVPDLLVVDYADLMSIGSKDYRHELGNLYKDLRGLAVKRHLALATASQANREASGKKTITGRGVAEDYSKIATGDVILTYNRTEAEHNLGTARLYVDKGRNDEDKFSILISQNYKTGQFCLDSTRMIPRYWQNLLEEDESEDSPPRKKRASL